jgi:Flp pilus assembly protein TadD
VSDERNPGVRARRIGVLSLRLNEPKTAVLWLRRAEAATPDDTSVLAPLADALFRVGDRVAARTTAERGLKLEPTNVALRNVELKTRD